MCGDCGGDCGFRRRGFDGLPNPITLPRDDRVYPSNTARIKNIFPLALHSIAKYLFNYHAALTLN